MVSVQEATGADFDPAKAETALVALLVLVNKGVAHLTTAYDPAERQLLRHAAGLTKHLVEQYVYRAAGLSLPAPVVQAVEA